LAVAEVERDTLMSTMIYDVDDLQAMQNDLAGSYYLANNIDASVTSGWNGGAGFDPIGNGESSFNGIFDGNGHTITNLFINRLSTLYLSLFGGVGGSAEIKNVGMVDVDMVGGQYVGGLIGYSFSTGTISNCYSTGSINGHNYQTGGLIGRLSFTTLSNCYSNVSVIGVNRVGGLIGEANATVINCYSIGAVSGSGSDVGGLIGKNDGSTYNDCFWDTETSGQATSAGGTGKTTAEMYQELTFENWDFTTIWAIVEDVSYPTLQEGGQELTKTLTDILSLSDGRVSKASKILSDVFSFSDAAVRKFRRPLTDTLSLSDTQVKKVSKSLSDRIWLSDIIATFLRIPGAHWNLHDRVLDKYDWSEADKKDTLHSLRDRTIDKVDYCEQDAPSTPHNLKDRTIDKTDWHED
jgi:hypothetical protein